MSGPHPPADDPAKPMPKRNPHKGRAIALWSWEVSQSFRTVQDRPNARRWPSGSLGSEGFTRPVSPRSFRLIGMLSLDSNWQTCGPVALPTTATHAWRQCLDKRLCRPQMPCLFNQATLYTDSMNRRRVDALPGQWDLGTGPLPRMDPRRLAANCASSRYKCAALVITV